MKSRTDRHRATRPEHRSEPERDESPGAGEQAGEAVGGIGGTLAGAALGSLAGPVGTVLGGIAGALGGWWAGEKAGRAAEDMGDHDAHYREHWERNRSDRFDYDTARVGYAVGHVAGRNPDYAGRSFDEVEPDIRRGWRDESLHYEWLRPYLRVGYEYTNPSATTGGHNSNTYGKMGGGAASGGMGDMID